MNFLTHIQQPGVGHPSAIPAPGAACRLSPVAPRPGKLPGDRSYVSVSLQDGEPVHTACGPWTRRGCCSPTAPTVQPPSAGAGAGPDPRLWPGRRGVRAPLSAVIYGRHIPYEDYTLALFRTSTTLPPKESAWIFIQFQFSPSWQ